VAQLRHRYIEGFPLCSRFFPTAAALFLNDLARYSLVTSETVGEMLMLHEALPAGARLGPWTRPTGA
jgi:hypothetical protein